MVCHGVVLSQFLQEHLANMSVNDHPVHGIMRASFHQTRQLQLLSLCLITACQSESCDTCQTRHCLLMMLCSLLVNEKLGMPRLSIRFNTACSPLTGTYSTAVGASNTSTCQPCIGNNVYSPSGSAACSICSPGTVLFRSAWSSNDTTNNAACLACPAGSYRSATMDKCTACNPGKHSPMLLEV